MLGCLCVRTSSVRSALRRPAGNPRRPENERASEHVGSSTTAASEARPAPKTSSSRRRAGWTSGAKNKKNKQKSCSTRRFCFDGVRRLARSTAPPRHPKQAEANLGHKSYAKCRVVTVTDRQEKRLFRGRRGRACSVGASKRINKFILINLIKYTTKKQTVRVSLFSHRVRRSWDSPFYRKRRCAFSLHPKQYTTHAHTNAQAHKPKNAQPHKRAHKHTRQRTHKCTHSYL